MYPAKDLCSQCGLCDSRWVAYVKDSCAFLNQRFDAMEAAAHGRSRDLDNEDELELLVVKSENRPMRPIAVPIDYGVFDREFDGGYGGSEDHGGSVRYG